MVAFDLVTLRKDSYSPLVNSSIRSDADQEYPETSLRTNAAVLTDIWYDRLSEVHWNRVVKPVYIYASPSSEWLDS